MGNTHHHTSPASHKTFQLIALCQVWNMFAYSGLQSIILLYLVETKKFSDSSGNILMGAFAALYCIAHIVGGWAGDVLLDHRSAMFRGSLALGVGYFLLGLIPFDTQFLYIALAIISLGNGFFSTNAASVLRNLYTTNLQGSKNQPNTDIESVFTYYYLAINVGSVLAKFSIPWVQSHLGWQMGFIVCFLGILIEIWMQFIFSKRKPTSIPSKSHNKKYGKPLWTVTCLFILFFTVIALKIPLLAEASIWCSTVGTLLFFIFLYSRSHSIERYNLAILYIMMGQSVIFFILFQQMDTSLTLFALHHTMPTFHLGDITLFSWSAGQFKTLNPFWVIIFSPVLVWVYKKRNNTHQPSLMAHKFFGGFVALSISFFIWWIFCLFATSAAISPWVMVLGYLFFSIGELLIAGLGLAAIAKYSPPQATGTMMGCYYIISGSSLYIGSLVANWASYSARAIPVTPTQSLHDYTELFGFLTLFALLGSLISAGCFPLLHRLERAANHNIHS